MLEGPSRGAELEGWLLSALGRVVDIQQRHMRAGGEGCGGAAAAGGGVRIRPSRKQRLPPSRGEREGVGAVGGGGVEEALEGGRSARPEWVKG